MDPTNGVRKDRLDRVPVNPERSHRGNNHLNSLLACYHRKLGDPPVVFRPVAVRETQIDRESRSNALAIQMKGGNRMGAKLLHQACRDGRLASARSPKTPNDPRVGVVSQGRGADFESVRLRLIAAGRQWAKIWKRHVPYSTVPIAD